MRPARPATLARCCLAGLVACALAAPAGARDLTGQFAYRERIALAPGAMLIVEAADDSGQPLAALYQPTGGAQVPLGFALAVPDGVEVHLRGGLALEGEVRWLSAPIAVAAGASAADLGTIALTPYRAVGLARHFRCGDLAVAADLGAEGGTLRAGPRFVTLAPVPAASGAKYADPADPATWAWSTDDALTVSIGGTALPECTPALPATDRWRAAGHEPEWVIEVRAGQIRLTAPGADTGEAALPAAEPAGAGLRYRLDAIGVVLDVTPGLCRDSMTGMPHPDRVALAEGGRSLDGCGGDPAALIAGPEWRIAELAGAPLPEGAEANLRFSPGGALSGKAACNRFAGRYTLTGEGLRLDPGAMTMMACPEPVMAAERAILDALGQIDRFDFDAAGDLLLVGGDAVLLRARF